MPQGITDHPKCDEMVEVGTYYERRCKNPRLKNSTKCNSHDPERIKARARSKEQTLKEFIKRHDYNWKAGRLCRKAGITLDQLKQGIVKVTIEDSQ